MQTIVSITIAYTSLFFHITPETFHVLPEIAVYILTQT